MAGLRLTRGECYALAGLGIVALAFMAAASKSAPGASMKVPARNTEDIPPFVPPPGRPVLGPDQHIGGVIYTPHRYPPACGADLTVAIHRGLTQLSLPASDDMLWLSDPPSEGDL